MGRKKWEKNGKREKKIRVRADPLAREPV